MPNGYSFSVKLQNPQKICYFNYDDNPNAPQKEIKDCLKVHLFGIGVKEVTDYQDIVEALIKYRDKIKDEKEKVQIIAHDFARLGVEAKTPECRQVLAHQYSLKLEEVSRINDQQIIATTIQTYMNSHRHPIEYFISSPTEKPIRHDLGAHW